jgi:hypothetical protein
MSNLTTEDTELARRYLIIRSAIKGMTHDKAVLQMLLRKTNY